MTNVIQPSDTTTDFGSGRRAVLEKRWIEAPAETTSVNFERVVKQKNVSDTSDQSNLTSSRLLADSDLMDHMLGEVLAYQRILVKDMLQSIESTLRTSYIHSMDSSTPIQDYYLRHTDARSVKNEVDKLFSHATFIDLEPGMANEFSEGLEQAVERHGSQALDEIKHIILNEETASSIAMEALKYIGNSDSKRWYNERRLMLEDCLLGSQSAWVRDGAGLGLSFLGDQRSISVLERAIQQEPSRALKRDLQQVLRGLKKSASES